MCVCEHVCAPSKRPAPHNRKRRGEAKVCGLICPQRSLLFWNRAAALQAFFLCWSGMERFDPGTGAGKHDTGRSFEQRRAARAHLPVWDRQKLFLGISANWQYDLHRLKMILKKAFRKVLRQECIFVKQARFWLLSVSSFGHGKTMIEVRSLSIQRLKPATFTGLHPLQGEIYGGMWSQKISRNFLQAKLILS